MNIVQYVNLALHLHLF